MKLEDVDGAAVREVIERALCDAPVAGGKIEPLGALAPLVVEFGELEHPWEEVGATRSSDIKVTTLLAEGCDSVEDLLRASSPSIVDEIVVGTERLIIDDFLDIDPQKVTSIASAAKVSKTDRGIVTALLISDAATLVPDGLYEEVSFANPPIYRTAAVPSDVWYALHPARYPTIYRIVLLAWTTASGPNAILSANATVLRQRKRAKIPSSKLVAA